MAGIKNFFNNMFSTEENNDLLEDGNKNKADDAKPASGFRSAKPEQIAKPKPVNPYTISGSPKTSEYSPITPPAFKVEKTVSAKVHTFEPKTIDDAKKAIDYLNNGYALLLNLENIDNSLSQRIVDVVSGALYLMDGSYNVVTDNIYLMAPKGIEITSPLTAENSVDKNLEKNAANKSFSFRK